MRQSFEILYTTNSWSAPYKLFYSTAWSPVALLVLSGVLLIKCDWYKSLLQFYSIIITLETKIESNNKKPNNILIEHNK